MPSPRQLFTYPLLGLVLLLPPAAHALILYSGDNSENLTAPDAERTDIFNAVGRSSNGGNGSGSVVYLGGKYALTANHVNLLSKITFDGTTYWDRDTAFGSGGTKRIGSTDMKVIKLKEVPTGVIPVVLNADKTENNLLATLVGWGRGVNPSDTTGPTWTWEGSTGTTEARRWATNQISNPYHWWLNPDAELTIDYSDLNTTTYSNQQVLRTYNDDNAGNDEGGVSYLDSGGGLFAKFGNEWRLVGLTVIARQLGGDDTVTFDNNDFSCYIRISYYKTYIEAAIPDTSTYDGWKEDHSVTDTDDSDTDFDGIPLLLEFAFNGDPNDNDNTVLPTHQLVDDGGSQYLELSYIRPVDHNLVYTPKTTSDIDTWPANSTGVNAESVVNNGDGTETVTHRRTLPVSSSSEAFIRVDVSVQP